jgi:hypothetical protein
VVAEAVQTLLEEMEAVVLVAEVLVQQQIQIMLQLELPTQVVVAVEDGMLLTEMVVLVVVVL